MQLPIKLLLDQMQTKWKSILDPLIANPLNSINVLENIKLNNGVTVVNHKLQTIPQGWFLIDPQGAATVYRSAPYTKLTLTLTSDAQIITSIGVY